MGVDLLYGNLPTGAQEIAHPPWDQVSAAIRALDGADSSEVVIERSSEGSHLSIGGGAGQYFVYAMRAEDDYLKLRNRNLSNDPVSAVVGGQRITCLAHEFVGLDEALRVARVFFNTGSLVEDAVWTTEPPDAVPNP